MAEIKQSFIDNITGVPALWDRIVDKIMNNRFDATSLAVNPKTGRLTAHQESNLKFSIDSNGHLINEVI